MKEDEARKLAKRFGIRMCDENGDTHGEELYCLSLEDIIEMAKALAQSEQEPVAWVCRHKLDLANGKTSLLCTTDKEMANAWLSDYKEGYAWLSPVYDTPPQRTWVGLTDDEMTECIVSICNTDDGTGDTRDLICAVEAKLKEKNT